MRQRFSYDDTHRKKDVILRAVVEAQGGRIVSSTVFDIGPNSGERWIECEVPDDRAEETELVLGNAGILLREGKADGRKTD